MYGMLGNVMECQGMSGMESHVKRRKKKRGPRQTRPRDKGVRLAIDAAGSLYALAQQLGIKQQAVGQWLRIPTGRIIQVEKATGVPREKLRPDLYR
jgi:Bacterial toxin YdaS